MQAVFDERRYLIPFRAALLPQIFTDVLVIGSGVAGMRAAVAAVGDESERTTKRKNESENEKEDSCSSALPLARSSEGVDIILVSKGKVEQSNTFWAQGGIAAVLKEEDSFESHIADTLEAGAGLCDEAIVRQVVETAPARVRELIDWGMRFDRAEGNKGTREQESDKLLVPGSLDPSIPGSFAFGREGGHSAFRILHADGDATGKELATTLDRQVRQNEHIRIFEDCFVLDLITLESVNGNGGEPVSAGGLGRSAKPQAATGRCLGAITHHPKYGLQVIWAAATILASGGCGQVYRESTNPAVATGDGLAMAYRAGAQLADMAFMQFHPTTLYVAGASRSLITEAVRGEGGRLVDRNGYRFMFDYDERGELAPRDIVARAILEQMARTGHTNVYLDVTHLGGDVFAHRFPGINRLLKKFDIDPGTDLIPVHPSAHYMIGGVRTDDHGRASIPGLYACGEVACTGLHGANRLASNSLLEGLVFGDIAGRTCHEMIQPASPHSPMRIISTIPLSERSELDLADVRSSLRSVMWRHVGIQREGERLDEVAEMFEFWGRYTMDKIFDDPAGWEVQNLLTVGGLINQAARWRLESRGAHYRVDHPAPSEAFRVHAVWRRGESEPTVEQVELEPRMNADEHG